MQEEYLRINSWFLALFTSYLQQQVIFVQWTRAKKILWFEHYEVVLRKIYYNLLAQCWKIETFRLLYICASINSLGKKSVQAVVFQWPLFVYRKIIPEKISSEKFSAVPHCTCYYLSNKQIGTVITTNLLVRWIYSCHGPWCVCPICLKKVFSRSLLASIVGAKCISQSSIHGQYYSTLIIYYTNESCYIFRMHWVAYTYYIMYAFS